MHWGCSYRSRWGGPKTPTYVGTFVDVLWREYHIKRRKQQYKGQLEAPISVDGMPATY